MKRLTLSEITNIAEIIGAFAIVASLIFVGLQIRQNTNQIRANSVQMGLAFVEAQNNLLANPENAELDMKGIHDFDALSPLEKARFDALLGNVMTKFFMARQYYLQGSLPKTDFESYEGMFASLMRSPGVTDWWNRTKDQNPKFVQEVIDGIIQRYHDAKPYSDYLKFQQKSQ